MGSLEFKEPKRNMTYNLRFHPGVDKDLKRIPPSDIKHIIQAIKDKLYEKPVEYGSQLHGKLKNLYKLRVSDYRIIYSVQGDIVFILVIAQRGKVYEIIEGRL